MDNIYNEYSKLSSLPEISNWNTNNVTNMKTIFEKCSSLTTLSDILRLLLIHKIFKYQIIQNI